MEQMRHLRKILLSTIFVVLAIGVRADDQPAPLTVVDRLHVTGQTIDVDIETYRLRVTGAVEHTLALSMADLQAMESERIYMILECPGVFVDQGYWTGVPVQDVLELAGVSEHATGVRFVCLDNAYITALPLDVVVHSTMLLAYQFDDKPFAPYHGFPLRLAAKDQPGSIWVKWLGQIEVLE